MTIQFNAFEDEAWQALQADEEVRFNRRLGIDDNREGDEWNQSRKVHVYSCTSEHKGPCASNSNPSEAVSTPEPQIQPDLCIDCMKPLIHEPGGCRCALR